MEGFLLPNHLRCLTLQVECAMQLGIRRGAALALDSQLQSGWGLHRLELWFPEGPIFWSGRRSSATSLELQPMSLPRSTSATFSGGGPVLTRTSSREPLALMSQLLNVFLVLVPEYFSISLNLLP